MRFHRMKKKCVAFDRPLDLNPTIAMSEGSTDRDRSQPL